MWTPTMGSLQRHILIVLTLLHICKLLLIEASGLKECLTKSKRCLGSESMSEIFQCHTRGRFPHPTNATVLLRCPDPGYKACLCHCKYEQMCFDLKTSTCKFIYLDDIIDCTRPLMVRYTEAVTRLHPPVPHPNLFRGPWAGAITENSQNMTKDPTTSKQRSIQQNESNIKTVLATKAGSGEKKQGTEKAGDLHITQVLHEHSLVHTNPNHKPSFLQKTTISARQVSKPLKLIVQDHSVFPTWAVALVVLCIIILLVLIVLLMY